MRSLSDTWHGTFAYPHTLPETAFVATLLDDAGLLAGAMHERRAHPPFQGQLLHASFDGTHHAGHVQFLKTYDPTQFATPPPPIEYEGEVNQPGTEIAGVWRIGRQWSGRFIMVRLHRRAFAAARERQLRLLLTQTP